MSGVTPEVLAARYPRLYHMAELGSWPSIQRHGLLSTSALLDRFEITGVARAALEERHRPESVPIEHPVHGTAVIRDQKPMSDGGLVRAFQAAGEDLTPTAWYRLLNEKVFFWLTTKRLSKLSGAEAYRENRKTILTVDTAQLLLRHRERVRLSPMNSGCTRPMPHPRGRRTFLPLNEYPFRERIELRREPVVELTVQYAVKNIAELIVRVEEVGGGEKTQILWER